MSNPTTVRMDDGLDAAIRGLAEATMRTGEVPALKQSQIIRVLLKDSLGQLLDGEISIETVEGEIDGETLADLLPDHALARYKREQIKEESWLQDMKGGFEGRVRDALEKRFKNGYDPDEARDFAETYIKEAHLYWEIVEDDPETLNEKIDFVHERLEDFKQKHARSTYDPDAEFLSSFDGVEEGEKIEQAANRLDRALIEDADRMLNIGISPGGEQTSGRPEPLSATEARDRLAARTGVSEEEAEVAVKRAGGVFHEGEETETAVADGGEEDPELITDGGRDQPEQQAMKEDYWETLSTDGGETEEAEPRTVLDLVREACDPDDQLHSIVPTSRDGDVLYAWTVREQPAKSGSGSVMHLRLIKIDKDAKAATWTSYGTILSMTDNLQSGLVKAFARARDGGSDPGVFNGLNAGSDELAREMLAEDVETGAPTGEVEDFSDRSVEADDDVAYVTCEDCGQDLPKEEAENFGGGLIDAWVHSGPCPDEVEDDE